MDKSSARNDTPDFPAKTAIHYDKFFGPFYFEPYAIEMAKRIVPAGVAVALEIASGTGRVTRHIRAKLPADAKLIASDISEDMMAIAKEKLHGADITWQHIDAEELSFDDESIDLVVCCFGLMFVADKHRALTEVYRVLKPGGQFLFTTWDKQENNKASWFARSIAMEYLDKPLPESYGLPTSMHDEALITSLLRHAGFDNISIEKKQLLSVSETAKEAASGLLKGGIYDDIGARNPSWIEEIRIRLEKELAENFGDAPMAAPMSAVMGEVWK